VEREGNITCHCALFICTAEKLIASRFDLAIRAGSIVTNTMAWLPKKETRVQAVQRNFFNSSFQTDVGAHPPSPLSYQVDNGDSVSVSRATVACS
jgi:hypothetical protein